MVDSKEIVCKIVTYYDKEYQLTIDKTASIKQLKEKLKELDENMSDVKLISSGRLIRNDETLISSYTTESTATFYVNQAQVHGGCCPKNSY